MVADGFASTSPHSPPLASLALPIAAGATNEGRCPRRCASAPPPASALASSKSTTSPLLMANLRRLLYHGARVGEDRVGVDARLVERGGGASARERSRLDQGRQRGPAHQGSDARVSNRLLGRRRGDDVPRRVRARRARR